MWAWAGLTAGWETSHRPSCEVDVDPGRPSVQGNVQAPFASQATRAATYREQLPAVTGGQSRLILAVRFDLVMGTEFPGSKTNCPHIDDQ